jgi:hypothetical protein
VFSLCDGRRSVLEIADLVQQHYGLEQPPIDDITRTVAELTEQGVMVE